MKFLILFLIILSLIPASIITMMWGWGLSPHNWGWIAFGYAWSVVPSLAVKALK